VLIFASR